MTEEAMNIASRPPGAARMSPRLAHQAGYSRTETELHERFPHVLHNHVTSSRICSSCWLQCHIRFT